MQRVAHGGEADGLGFNVCVATGVLTAGVDEVGLAVGRRKDVGVDGPVADPVGDKLAGGRAGVGHLPCSHRVVRDSRGKGEEPMNVVVPCGVSRVVDVPAVVDVADLRRPDVGAVGHVGSGAGGSGPDDGGRHVGAAECWNGRRRAETDGCGAVGIGTVA